VGTCGKGAKRRIFERWLMKPCANFPGSLLAPVPYFTPIWNDPVCQFFFLGGVIRSHQPVDLGHLWPAPVILQEIWVSLKIAMEVGIICYPFWRIHALFWA
jgi:hypothetical protein